METYNIIMIILGVLISIQGIGTYFYPNLARWIILPGSHIVKAIFYIAIGSLIIIIFLMDIILKL